MIEGAGCDGLAVLPGAVACFAVCTKMGFSKTVLYMVMTHAKGVCVVDDKREGYCLERFESYRSLGHFRPVASLQMAHVPHGGRSVTLNP